MEMVLVKLASLPTGIEVAALVRKLESLERKLGAAGGVIAAPNVASVPTEAPSRSAPDSSPPLPPDPTGKKPEAPSAPVDEKSWAGLVEFVKQRRRPRISALLEQSSLLALELPQVRIGMQARYFSLADAEMRQAIEGLATEYYGTEAKVEFKKVDEVAQAPPSLHEERIRLESDRQKKLRENAAEHPMVKTALDIFGGQIEDIKPIDKGFV